MEPFPAAVALDHELARRVRLAAEAVGVGGGGAGPRARHGGRARPWGAPGRGQDESSAEGASARRRRTRHINTRGRSFGRLADSAQGNRSLVQLEDRGGCRVRF